MFPVLRSLTENKQALTLAAELVARVFNAVLDHPTKHIGAYRDLDELLTHDGDLAGSDNRVSFEISVGKTDLAVTFDVEGTNLKSFIEDSIEYGEEVKENMAVHRVIKLIIPARALMQVSVDELGDATIDSMYKTLMADAYLEADQVVKELGETREYQAAMRNAAAREDQDEFE